MDTTPNLADMLKMLTPLQLDYVAARINTQTDKTAADKLGIHPTTISKWPNLADVQTCISLAKQDGVILATEKLRRAASLAVDTIIDEMQARRGSSKRLDAAQTILDRLGVDVKQTIKQQVEQAGTVKVIIEYVELDADGTPTATETPPSAAPDR